jgi:predicted SAM-dependent methyltransferase
VRDLKTWLLELENPAAQSLLLRARALAHAVTRGHIPRRVVIGRYLASSELPRLQIGCGPLKKEGWLNSDLITGEIYLDLARRLPLPDASFAYVFGEHVIEHLAEGAGRRLLAELYRVTRPGGVLRLTTPDLRKYISLYEDRNSVTSLAEYTRYLDEITRKSHERACQVFNDFMRLWGHQYIYDEDDLTAKLVAAGFREVVRREPGESPHEALCGLEGHGGASWINRAEAMCLEATRP